MRVFYLDDDIEDLTLFSDILHELDNGIDCHASTDSAEALQHLQYNPAPDIIFLDFNMPGHTGEDCLSLIREMNHLKGVPVVIYSTGVNDKMKQRLLQKGADMVVRKHVTTAELKSFLKSTFLTQSGTQNSRP